MKNILIIGVVVVLVIAFVAWQFLGKGNNATPSDVAMQQDEAMQNDSGTSGDASSSQPERVYEDGHYITLVYFDGTSFSPETVTVDHGEAVRFINTSNLTMRVGSRTESLSSVKYSDITQTNPVGNGGTYDVVFNESGTWAYENLASINPRILGTVNVR